MSSRRTVNSSQSSPPSSSEPDAVVPIPWEPKDYMKKAGAWLVARSAAALFLDPGMGKTSICYAAVKLLKKKKLAKGALVVALRRPAVSVWPQERAKWTDFNELSVGLLRGPKKEHVLNEEHDVFVITFDTLDWLCGPPKPNFNRMPEPERTEQKALYKAEVKAAEARLKVLLSKVDILIIDELSKMKNRETRRHKVLDKHLGRFARRWGLTGSPAANGLENLFGQVYALDLGKAFGPYITYYRQRYFDDKLAYPGDPYPTRVLKPGAKEEIYRAIKPLALRLDAEDYLKLPQTVPVPLRFELEPAHRAQYDEMYEEMILALPSGELFTAKAASTVSMKCRQITSGALYHDKVDPLTGEPRTGPRKWTALHDEKIQATLDLIDELQGAQLLIAYEFQHELERLIKALGKDTAYIGKGISDKKALAYERAWNAGELPVLVAHPQSMGHGLNLQGSSAHHILWFSGTWDFELFDQFNRRLKRQGSTAERLFVYSLIARDTVDEAVYNDKFQKRNEQKSLLDALRTRVRR